MVETLSIDDLVDMLQALTAYSTQENAARQSNDLPLARFYICPNCGEILETTECGDCDEATLE